MMNWTKVLAFPSEIIYFVCEFEDSPAEDTGVAAHDAVEGAEGVGTGVKVEGPVAGEGGVSGGQDGTGRGHTLRYPAWGRVASCAGGESWCPMS